MIVVDGPFLAYRAFSVGGADAMIGATLRTVLQLQHEENDQVVVVWELADGAGIEYRRTLANFEDYKGRRRPKPQDFTDALRWLQQHLHQVFGVLQLWPTQGEADDAACTLVRHRTGPVVLWTADHDWFQLVDAPDVAMFRIKSGAPQEVITYQNIAECTGWTASEWTNLMSLAGDLGDDIPGLPRIGLKRAGELLRACPNIVQLVLAGEGEQAVRKVMAADASMAKWAQVVANNAVALDQTRRMVQLYDVGCTVYEGHDWAPGTPAPALDQERARAVLADLGQRSTANYLPPEPDAWDEATPVDAWG